MPTSNSLLVKNSDNNVIEIFRSGDKIFIQNNELDEGCFCFFFNIKDWEVVVEFINKEFNLKPTKNNAQN